MQSEFIKTIFFASFVCAAGVVLTPDAWGADTLVYAIVGGSDSLGTLDLNTGVFTQISTQAVSDYELGVYGGVLYGGPGAAPSRDLVSSKKRHCQLAANIQCAS